MNMEKKKDERIISCLPCTQGYQGLKSVAPVWIGRDCYSAPVINAKLQWVCVSEERIMRPRLKKRGALSKNVLSRQQHKTYFHNTSSRFQPSSHYVSDMPYD
eukprot:TRINITY_DN4085_c0_g1_i1.p1 TRINITY_DN4085_c0_g1~~TRINITY_DN4085_c0_g1_i1.p1  ORF type:complete len:102 (+),score=8.16 TRINITY_DN4085_c0_g1_i1:600-905(+)